MFYKKRIEALEKRVAALEERVCALGSRADLLTKTAQVQSNEIELLLAQLAGTQKQKKEAEPTRMPRRYRRRKNGKETSTTE